MAETPQTIKVVRFPPPHPSTAPDLCQSCGGDIQATGVCRRCAFLLVDLALSTVDEEFPRLISGVPERTSPQPQETQHRYAHYDLCVEPDGSLSELGRGAMGITYKARDTHLGTLVALKVINPAHITRENGRERFLREARIAASLKHPNIASIYHLGLGGDTHCFYAMELVDGETLESAVCREGALPPKSAVEIVFQTAQALRIAHRQGFIHRDLKPTNLMLVLGEGASAREFGERVAPAAAVKIIDFGLVKAISEEEGTGWTTLCRGYFAGTPVYAAPEQLAGGRVDARTDVYALGRCLWHMLAGEAPRLGVLEGPAVSEALRNKHVPNDVLRLVESMTADDPKHRPQTAEELLERLQGIRARMQVSRQTDAPLRSNNLRNWLGVSSMMLVGLTALVTWRPTSGSWVHNMSEDRAFSTTQPASTEARLFYAKGDECREKITASDNRQALGYYTKAIQLSPGFADAHAASAMIHLQNVARFGAPASELDLALTSAERAIALDPGSPAGYSAMGGIRTLQGKHWAALAEYRHALELDPKYPPAMRGFSLLWTAVGQPQRGIPWGKAATQIDPLSTSSWSAAADPSVDLGADEQAETFYRRCLQVNPAWMSAHNGLIHLHLLQGNFVQARADGALAESIDPQLIQPLILKAQIAFFSGEYAEAETLYRMLLARERDGRVHYYSSISYLSALGYLRCRAGDFTEGRALLEEAANLHVKDSEGPQAIYDLAAIRAIQGRRPEALSLLQQAISSGWMDYRATRLDPRFETLRGEEAFRSALAGLSLHVKQMRLEAEKLCAKILSLADYPVPPSTR